MPGGGEQLPGWVVSCTATSCSCSRGRPSHLFAPRVLVTVRNLLMVWYGMVEVCEGAPVAVSGWVLADRHDVRPCAASSLHRGTITVSNIIGGTGTLELGIA